MRQRRSETGCGADPADILGRPITVASTTETVRAAHRGSSRKGIQLGEVADSMGTVR